MPLVKQPQVDIELCPVDLHYDGDTRLLLDGTELFLQPGVTWEDLLSVSANHLSKVSVSRSPAIALGKQGEICIAQKVFTRHNSLSFRNRVTTQARAIMRSVHDDVSQENTQLVKNAYFGYDIGFDVSRRRFVWVTVGECACLDLNESTADTPLNTYVFHNTETDAQRLSLLAAAAFLCNQTTQ